MMNSKHLFLALNIICIIVVVIILFVGEPLLSDSLKTEINQIPQETKISTDGKKDEDLMRHVKLRHLSRYRPGGDTKESSDVEKMVTCDNTGATCEEKTRTCPGQNTTCVEKMMTCDNTGATSSGQNTTCVDKMVTCDNTGATCEEKTRTCPGQVTTSSGLRHRSSLQTRTCPGQNTTCVDKMVTRGDTGATSSAQTSTGDHQDVSGNTGEASGFVSHTTSILEGLSSFLYVPQMYTDKLLKPPVVINRGFSSNILHGCYPLERYCEEVKDMFHTSRQGSTTLLVLIHGFNSDGMCGHPCLKQMIQQVKNVTLLAPHLPGCETYTHDHTNITTVTYITFLSRFLRFVQQHTHNYILMGYSTGASYLLWLLHTQPNLQPRKVIFISPNLDLKGHNKYIARLLTYPVGLRLINTIQRFDYTKDNKSQKLNQITHVLGILELNRSIMFSIRTRMPLSVLFSTQDPIISADTIQSFLEQFRINNPQTRLNVFEFDLQTHWMWSDKSFQHHLMKEWIEVS